VELLVEHRSGAVEGAGTWRRVRSTRLDALDQKEAAPRRYRHRSTTGDEVLRRQDGVNVDRGVGGVRESGELSGRRGPSPGACRRAQKGRGRFDGAGINDDARRPELESATKSSVNGLPRPILSARRTSETRRSSRRARLAEGWTGAAVRR
jgi:hypothetical protein